MRNISCDPIAKLEDLVAAAPSGVVYFALGYRHESDRDRLLESLGKSSVDANSVVFLIKANAEGQTISGLQVAAVLPFVVAFVGLVPVSDCRTPDEVSEMVTFANNFRATIGG